MKHLRRKLEFIRQQMKDIRAKSAPSEAIAHLTRNVDEVLNEMEGYAHALEDILGDVKLTKE